MLEYLKKFNNLPAALRQKVSSAPALAVIEALEKKYKVALAALIMKVMVKEIPWGSLADYLIKEKLTKADADELARELREKIFVSMADYFSLAAKAVSPPPSQPAVKGAGFFFSADDEAEIRELAKKVEPAEKMERPSAEIEEKLKTIVSQVQINFGSADLAARFSQILKTYLRGIRNRLGTKLTLIKPFANGGLSFDEDSAERVLTLADKIIKAKPGQTFGQPPKIRLPQLEKISREQKEKINRDVPYNFSRLKKLDIEHELPAPAKPIASRPEAKKIEPLAPAPPQNIDQMPLVKRRFQAENLNQNPKVKVEDVKYIPKVMGPLDEIKYLDLISFRRLGNDPVKTAEKIKEKINLLEEEDYGKRLEAIKAWRASPLNRLYLSIGQFSISENKPVDVIIEEKKTAGEECLTSEEFSAVMDLNKSLRF